MTDTCSTTIPSLRGPVTLSHLFLHSFVRNGYLAVDATCGNGNDTLLLASLVGNNGHVWGFDIQQQAITETVCRVTDAKLSERVTLLHTGHEEMALHVLSPVQVVLFNLGYRPGGDRTIITHPDTTVVALTHSLCLLSTGGVIIVTVYPGHDGGLAEQSAVENWAAGLDPHACHCWRMGQTNVARNAPYLLLIQKSL